MYEIISALLSDRKGGEIFVCFGFWHICCLFIAVAAAVWSISFLRRKPGFVRQRALDLLISCAFGLYIADFFLMPFAYGKIDVEKLPFHVCTAMCLMCFLSRHTRFWAPYRSRFAVLGLVSNLVYLIYPAGVMWHQVHPVSYRVIQTLGFHGVMSVYGLLALVFEEPPQKKTHRRDLAVITGMTLWALLGNLLYGSSAEGHPFNFNWFFVLRDPFYLLPEAIAPWIMPPLNVALFFAAEQAVYGLCRLVQKKLVPENT